MRLSKIQDYMKSKHISYTYSETNDCGSIDFIHRGLSYHIWEYPAPERGVQSNVRCCGRSEDFDGSYEDSIVNILKTW